MNYRNVSRPLVMSSGVVLAVGVSDIQFFEMFLRGFQIQNF